MKQWKNWGFAIQHLSEKLKNDKDVILEVVRNNWASLKFVSNKLSNVLIQNIEVRELIKKNIHEIENHQVSSTDQEKQKTGKAFKYDPILVLLITEVAKVDAKNKIT